MTRAAEIDRTLSSSKAGLEIGLNAAILSVHENRPQIVVVLPKDEGAQPWDSLPFGPFAPLAHRTLEIGLRSWVQEQTGLELGYVEQLYTFGDRGRHAQQDNTGPHAVSIGYLALTRIQPEQNLSGGVWQGWYRYFPWEDRRNGKSEMLSAAIEPRLKEWAEGDATDGTLSRPFERAARLRICFGVDDAGWDEEKVLERYELLYEAGLIAEAERDGLKSAEVWADLPEFGKPMRFDHRRILATAMSRLRAKIKYRPVIFELMPERFTLFEMQKTVEAISGSLLHKQNFRRLVENAGLVEETGEVSTMTGGRPAKLFRFRPDVLQERPAPGVRVTAGRS